VFAQVSAAFQPGLEHTGAGAYIASSAVLALLVGAMVLVPWDRMPVWCPVLVVAPASLCPCEGVLPAVSKCSSTCSARMEGDDGCEGCGQAGRDRR
jgi:hypothetical protein